MDRDGGGGTAIGEDTFVPDLLASAPGLRRVLDRHGLRGCGGRGGPPETLAFFARAHGVPLPSLLGELRTAAATGGAAGAAAAEPARPWDSIHRGYFGAGVAVILTAGAAWGAWILLRIARDGGFAAAGVDHVNAHGHAQVVGWLGLFAMGFAFQAFPRFLATPLPWPRLAMAALPAVAAGIVLRVLGEAAVGGPAGLAMGLAAGALETAAALVFAASVFRMTREAGERAASLARWVRPAAAWFVVSAAGEALLFAATSTAGDAATLVSRVATWQPALRSAEFHGFALLLVLGVAGRYLPAILGLPQPSPRASRLLYLLAAPIAVVEIGGWLGWRLGGVRALAAASSAGGLLLLAAALVAAASFGVFRPSGERHRGLPFVRASFAWLLASAVMLAAAPLYASAMGLRFSHAWMGATRHAITVGFFSGMILGVSSKVVPTLEGADPARLPSLVPSLVLLNLGCFLRVSLQVLTDAHPWAFPLVGISGVLEVAALALWGIPLALLMARGANAPDSVPAGRPADAGEPGPDTLVLDLLEARPAALEILAGHYGLAPLRNAAFRATVARGVTLRRAAGIAGVPVERILEDLRAAEA